MPFLARQGTQVALCFVRAIPIGELLGDLPRPVHATNLVVARGSGADVPVPGDYDGDGKADPAVFRSTGDWAILPSFTN